MFGLYAKHNQLLSDLNESMINITSKAMIYYRSVKHGNIGVMDVNMELPFEQSYIHAIGRSWNNMTNSKAKELETFLERRATDLAISKEPSRETKKITNYLTTAGNAADGEATKAQRTEEEQAD